MQGYINCIPSIYSNFIDLNDMKEHSEIFEQFMLFINEKNTHLQKLQIFILGIKLGTADLKNIII